ncbi:uncharacterized protein LOC125227179 isoform X3 [Leguminivora glycinivorella]|uniref:uncharacterized protein LOC125227179 isoform X3 n=1 Tax=Leguminivora glycinivorella TaxID=1035111 RepID=UPI00200FF949|nr:uncharacterized protein LOC125227179 isoform X3 [Leguminivora glycinivorella]
MKIMETEDERTILDYLNEDCWRAVLQFVPAKDLIRTERASRRWQEVLLWYLKGTGVHIAIAEYHKEDNPSVCRAKRSSYTSFESWTKKLGSLVVDTYCIGLKSLEIIKENCPNLETLTLKDVQCKTPKLLLHHNLNDNFKCLQSLKLHSCNMFDEDIQAITRCCKELVTLKLSDCRSMSRRSVRPIWRNAGARLTELALRDFDEAKDADIVALIRGCPLLTKLTVTGSRQLTRRLPARAAAARRGVAPGKVLDLDLSFTNLSSHLCVEDTDADGPHLDVLGRKYVGLNIICF